MQNIVPCCKFARYHHEYIACMGMHHASVFTLSTQHSYLPVLLWCDYPLVIFHLTNNITLSKSSKLSRTLHSEQSGVNSTAHCSGGPPAVNSDRKEIPYSRSNRCISCLWCTPFFRTALIMHSSETPWEMVFSC